MRYEAQDQEYLKHFEKLEKEAINLKFFLENEEHHFRPELSDHLLTHDQQDFLKRFEAIIQKLLDITRTRVTEIEDHLRKRNADITFDMFMNEDMEAVELIITTIWKELQHIQDEELLPHKAKAGDLFSPGGSNPLLVVFIHHWFDQVDHFVNRIAERFDYEFQDAFETLRNNIASSFPPRD